MLRDYECPITHDIMVDPVVASDGFTYEREAIELVMKLSGTSPMTREPLQEQLSPNRHLKQEIYDYEHEAQTTISEASRTVLGAAAIVSHPQRPSSSQSARHVQPLKLNMASLVNTLRTDTSLLASFSPAKWMALDGAYMQYALSITELELSFNEHSAREAVGAQRALISELCKICSKNKVLTAIKTAERQSRGTSDTDWALS